MKLNTWMLILVCLFAGFGALAQEAAVVAPTYLDEVLKWLQNGSVLAAMAFIVELVARVWPTEKAKSLLVPVKYLIDGLVLIMIFISKNVLDPMITGLNRVK